MPKYKFTEELNASPIVEHHAIARARGDRK
jgi:hypothetical protein